MTRAVVYLLAAIAYLPPSSAPTATTNAATGITSSTATLNGAVNPNGSATTVSFEWGLTPGYGNTTEPQAIGSGTSSVDVSAALAGLTPNRTYHYRVVATNECGSGYGSDATFMTAPLQRTLTLSRSPNAGLIKSTDGRLYCPGYFVVHPTQMAPRWS
jgi:phosphodiesterase/alkaline phosphatase D-like protein